MSSVQPHVCFVNVLVHLLTVCLAWCNAHTLTQACDMHVPMSVLHMTAIRCAGMIFAVAGVMVASFASVMMASVAGVMFCTSVHCCRAMDNSSLRYTSSRSHM